MSNKYKTMVIPCKVCAREFEFHCPLEFYESAVAAAEGEPVEFAGTCPECRKDDPFLRLMDGIPGIFTSRDFARSKQ